jgi:hypothetical protein
MQEYRVSSMFQEWTADRAPYERARRLRQAAVHPPEELGRHPSEEEEAT